MKTIKAIESGERKEISLGYRCRLEPTPGTINGNAYDAIPRDIVVNHVALGPKGWGRAGDCSIRMDHQKISLSQGKEPMNEVERLDGVDIALSQDNIAILLSEKTRQLEELRGRFDALGLELEKVNIAKAALEDPAAIESKVQSRIKLAETCRRTLEDDVSLEGKTNAELKLSVIKKFYPDINIEGRDQSYLDGMFEAIVTKAERNDSLSLTRQVINQTNTSNNNVYEKWLEHSAKLWTVPLTGVAK